MSVQFNGDAAKHQIEEAVGKRLLAAAVFFQTQHKLALNKSNPRPYLNSSRPGEYPRARTGFGRNNVAYDPADLATVIAEQKVRIGFLEPAWYMEYLAQYKGRLGLQATMERLKGQLAQMLEA